MLLLFQPVSKYLWMDLQVEFVPLNSIMLFAFDQLYMLSEVAVKLAVWKVTDFELFFLST